MMKYKVGDNVIALSGKDKGRKGKIEKIYPNKLLALVPELNIFKKHVKGAQGRKGGIYDIPKPLPFGKFALVCSKCNKTTRVGFKIVKEEKLRICKLCQKEID